MVSAPTVAPQLPSQLIGRSVIMYRCAELRLLLGQGNPQTAELAQCIDDWRNIPY